MNIISYDEFENKTIKEKTVCFTGGRPKSLFLDFGYDETFYNKMKSNLTSYIKNLYVEKGYRCFITGGAQGFDQTVFWCVRELQKEYPDIKNIVFAPFRNQSCKWAKSGLFSQNHYNAMLRCADEVVICRDDLNGRSSSKSELIRALFYRNKCMCKHSSMIVGQFIDDSWTKPSTKGGTAACLRFAKREDMIVDVRDFRKDKIQL